MHKDGQAEGLGISTNLIGIAKLHMISTNMVNFE